MSTTIINFNHKHSIFNPVLKYSEESSLTINNREKRLSYEGDIRDPLTEMLINSCTNEGQIMLRPKTGCVLLSNSDDYEGTIETENVSDLITTREHISCNYGEDTRLNWFLACKNLGNCLKTHYKWEYDYHNDDKTEVYGGRLIKSEHELAIDYLESILSGLIIASELIMECAEPDKGKCLTICNVTNVCKLSINKRVYSDETSYSFNGVEKSFIYAVAYGLLKTGLWSKYLTANGLKIYTNSNEKTPIINVSGLIFN